MAGDRAAHDRVDDRPVLGERLCGPAGHEREPELVVGGDSAGHPSGHFFSPAVVTGAAADTPLLSEETFGPVAPLFRFSTADEAVEIANNTPFGLAAYLHGRDIGRIWRAAEERADRLEAELREWRTRAPVRRVRDSATDWPPPEPNTEPLIFSTTPKIGTRTF